MAEGKHDAITGLILAGGAGRRMGGADKGLLKYRGQPLIRLAINRLAPQVDQLLISANRNLETYRELGYPVLSDAEADFPGPLAGLLAGLEACTTPWLMCVPCDGPEFPPDLVARLMEAAETALAPMAVARTAAGLQPTFQLCHRRTLPALRAYLASGERRVSAWCRQQGACEVMFDNAAAFSNFNSPEALQGQI